MKAFLSEEDCDFLHQFEQCTLPAEEFDHTGHLKLAYLMLVRWERDTAMQRILQGIERYAKSLGAAQKFHKTLSWFMVNEIAWRMSTQASGNWPDFLAANQDLVMDGQKRIADCYSASLLDSELARRTVVKPDKARPEWHV